MVSESLRLYGTDLSNSISKSNSMVRDLSKLFNGIAQTTSDQDMWLGRQIDSSPLQICFEVSLPPSKLCVWNYNSVSAINDYLLNLSLRIDQ